MEHHESLVLRIIKAVPSAGESKLPMDIILHRPYAHLLSELRNVYKDNKDITVKLDRRYGERRKEKRLVLRDSRYSDRRKQVEMNWQMNLIVHRRYVQLMDDLDRVFDGQEGVNIIMDGRHCERRKEPEMRIEDDRRADDRRKKSDTVVEVILSC